MKRISLIFTIIALVAFSVQAQKSKVNSADASFATGKLDVAKTAIDEGMQDQEMQQWDKAWYIKGKIYHAIFESPIPAYKALSDNPLEVALEAYLKQLELAKLPNSKGKVKKNKYEDDIMKRINVLKAQFINNGVEHFNAKKYTEAMNSFKKYVEITEMKAIGPDTLTKEVLYNTAVAAELGEDFENAAAYYSKAEQAGYNGENDNENIFLRIIYAHKQNKDTLSAFEAMQAGFTKYPDNKFITLELINYYLKNDMAQEALDFIQTAKEQDPENASLLFAEGTLHEKNKKLPEAEKAYQKAIDLKPDYFDAYYNLGALHYNHAASIIEDANSIPPGKTRAEKTANQEKYDAKISESKDAFKQAMPFMEKAHELKPEDVVVMQTLQTIYVRLQMYDKSKEIKEKLNK